jgi:hypothetical protein
MFRFMRKFAGLPSKPLHTFEDLGQGQTQSLACQSSLEHQVARLEPKHTTKARSLNCLAYPSADDGRYFKIILFEHHHMPVAVNAYVG